MEDTARVEINATTKKAHTARRAPPSTSELVYFDQVVVKVQPRTGDGEAQRVLKEHEQAWRDVAIIERLRRVDVSVPEAF